MLHVEIVNYGKEISPWGKDDFDRCCTAIEDTIDGSQYQQNRKHLNPIPIAKWKTPNVTQPTNSMNKNGKLSALYVTWYRRKI